MHNIIIRFLGYDRFTVVDKLNYVVSVSGIRTVLPREQKIPDMQGINPKFLEFMGAVVYPVPLPNNLFGKLNSNLSEGLNCNCAVDLAKNSKDVEVNIYTSSYSIYDVIDSLTFTTKSNIMINDKFDSNRKG